MFDSHVHSTFSTDSRMTIQEILQRSKELNVGIVLTEHLDLNFPDNSKYRFNIEEYFKQYADIRSDKLLLGIEIGMHKDYYKNNNFVPQKHDFDYVLGSLHFIEDNDIYVKETYEGKSKKEVYELYFQDIANNLRLHNNIDCLGHIDYICRYCIYEDKNISYNEFKLYIDEVLRLLVDKGIAIEINTRRFGNKEIIEDLIPVYKRYFELGGKYVVIGSDSHNSGSIAYKFDTAKELAESCSLTPVYFKQRKPQYWI